MLLVVCDFINCGLVLKLWHTAQYDGLGVIPVSSVYWLKEICFFYYLHMTRLEPTGWKSCL